MSFAWDDALEEGVRAAAAAVDADAAMVLVADGPLEHVMAHVGLPHALEISRAIASDLGLLRLLTPKGIFVDDTENHPQSRLELLDVLPMRAILGMPLTHPAQGGRVLGGLFLCARSPRNLGASTATMTPLLARLSTRLATLLATTTFGDPTWPYLRIVQAMQIGDVDGDGALRALRALPPVMETPKPL